MYTKKLFQHFADAWCVGSSHGWLVVFDNMSIPHLLNPITGDIFRLPSMSSLAQSFDKRRVLKAILSSHPLGQNNKKVSIVVMYVATLPNNVSLAFYESGQEGKWTELDGEHRNYCDVIFHNAQLYAITRNPSTLEIWDFGNSIPIKIMHIRPGVNKINSAPKRGYLVESLGEILRVEEFRDIYKLNSTGNKWGWEKVECLGDRVLFLGGNQSMSFSARDLPGCEENLIYFTPSHPQNNGYRTALGVYSLIGKVVESLYVIDHSNRYQPPFFIVPHP